MLENALDMVKLHLDKSILQMKKSSDISSFFLDRDRSKYYVEGFDDSVDYLRKYSNESEFDYAVWGLTYIAEMVCQYIAHNYPNAKLVAVFDKNKKTLFEDIQVQKIESVSNEKLYSMEIFVTAYAATKAAKRYFEEIGKEDKFCLCYEGK